MLSTTSLDDHPRANTLAAPPSIAQSRQRAAHFGRPPCAGKLRVASGAQLIHQIQDAATRLFLPVIGAADFSQQPHNHSIQAVVFRRPVAGLEFAHRFDGAGRAGPWSRHCWPSDGRHNLAADYPVALLANAAERSHLERTGFAHRCVSPNRDIPGDAVDPNRGSRAIIHHDGVPPLSDAAVSADRPICLLSIRELGNPMIKLRNPDILISGVAVNIRMIRSLRTNGE